MGVVLALSAFLPPTPRGFVALAAIILLGVPHGALDGELARTALRPRFGRLWFGVFSLPYLALSATVLCGWVLAPVPVLMAFLAASVWHFGTEETGSIDPVLVAGAGGAPVALAVLSHPLATAAILGTVSRTTMPAPPFWLLAASLAWLVPAGCRVLRLVRQGNEPALRRAAVMAAVAILLPPLTAFAIYFVCVHAPAHVAGLLADRRIAPRIRNARSAALLSVPVTLLTLLLGALLWPLYPGTPLPRLLCLTIEGLAALTLPHMLFETWLRTRGAPAR